MRIFNISSHTTLRKKLRNNPTNAENILWHYLKSKRLKGYKFRRQYGIGRYVIDFYCPKLRLGIEIDGDTHYLSKEVIEYDRKRQKYIEEFGIRLIRFTNDDVYTNIDGVMENIIEYL